MENRRVILRNDAAGFFGVKRFGMEGKMIISASRRTDIPCWYSEWFVNRLRAGYVLVRNPMNASQISRIPLRPDIVDCIVFWTKDAGPMMERLPELEKTGIPYCFQYTITPYGHELERGKNYGKFLPALRANRCRTNGMEI